MCVFVGVHCTILFYRYDWVNIPIRESSLCLLVFLNQSDSFVYPLKYVAIYAVVEGFAVTARIRLQLVAEAPFIRFVAFYVYAASLVTHVVLILT